MDDLETPGLSERWGKEALANKITWVSWFGSQLIKAHDVENDGSDTYWALIAVPFGEADARDHGIEMIREYLRDIRSKEVPK